MGGDYAEGTDYAVDYNFTKGTVIITSLDRGLPAHRHPDGQLLRGGRQRHRGRRHHRRRDGGGEYSGLSSIALLYPEQFAVCNLIAAPGWSHSPAVYNAMLAASQKINGHWDAFVVG